MKKFMIIFTVGAVLLTGCSAAPDKTGATKVVSVDVSTLSREHKDGDLGYDLSKSVPVGGEHNARWAACKLWYTPVATEYAIHSMEHGAVWIAYLGTVSDSEVERLEELTAKYPYLLATPTELLPAPIVVSAWGVQMTTNDAGDPKIEEFVKKYAQGPQTPEPGAPCKEGGVNTPAEANKVPAATPVSGAEAPATEGEEGESMLEEEIAP
jgi:hypothetical protein